MLRPPPPTPKAQFNTSGTSGNGKVQNISGEVNMYDSSDSEEGECAHIHLRRACMADNSSNMALQMIQYIMTHM